MKVVNLLDDFNLGGVTKGLSIYEEPEIRSVASVETVAVDPARFRAATYDADVVLTHFPPNWRRLPYLSSLRRRNPHARLVHVEHSYTKYWFFRNVRNQARFQKMLRLALGLFDEVVCVSNAQREWLTEFTGLPAEKFRTIYPYSNNPGIDVLALPTFAEQARLTVGTYGRLHPCKGFDRLIEAFKVIGPESGLDLVIGGSGTEEEAKLRALADGQPHIRFVGLVEDVAGFLDGCHVIAVPSRYEAFGQVALEARRAGRPLVVSDIDGLPEQVIESGLIVDCSSPHILQSALMLLKMLPLARLSRMSRESARDARVQSVNGWLSLIQQPGAEHSIASGQSGF